MLIIGLLLGAITGLVGGLLPGVSSHLLLFGLSMANLPGEIVFPAVIGSEAVSGLIKLLGLVNPVVMAEQVYSRGASLALVRAGKGPRVLADSAHAYLLVKVVILVAGGILLSTDMGPALKMGMLGQGIAIPIALFLWGSLIFQSKRRLAALGLMLVSVALGYMVVHWQGSSQTYSLITALVGISGALELLSNSSKSNSASTSTNNKTQAESSTEYTYLPLGAIIPGYISTIFVGLPGSALLSVVDNKEQDPYKRVIKGVVCEASTSAIGLIMTLGNLGSRSAASTIASNASNGPTSFLTSWLYLAITCLISVLVYSYLPSLAVWYTKLNQGMGNKLGGYISIIIAIASVFIISGWLALPLLVSGVLINHLLKGEGEDQLNPAIPLIGVSIIPLLSMVGL